jgi:hypothetical protein
MAPYWQHLGWVAYAAVGVGAWRYLPLSVVRLTAAFTRDDKRHRRCMDVLWLARRDITGMHRQAAAPEPAMKQSTAAATELADVIADR